MLVYLHDKIKNKLKLLIKWTFNREGKQFLATRQNNFFFTRVKIMTKALNPGLALNYVMLFQYPYMTRYLWSLMILSTDKFIGHSYGH